jgi:hypothetical protein
VGGPVEAWTAGDGYEPYVGRWSRSIALVARAWAVAGRRWVRAVSGG